MNAALYSAFRWKDGTDPTSTLWWELLDEFPSHLLLGMDAARRSDWRCSGGSPGLSWLLNHLAEKLTPGLREQVFVTNPALAHAFVPVYDLSVF